jgi:hypothetical protein
LTTAVVARLEETVMLRGVFLATVTVTTLVEVRLGIWSDVPYALGTNDAEMECWPASTNISAHGGIMADPPETVTVRAEQPEIVVTPSE